jgi:hypothetical protein
VTDPPSKAAWGPESNYSAPIILKQAQKLVKTYVCGAILLSSDLCTCLKLPLFFSFPPLLLG